MTERGATRTIEGRHTDFLAFRPPYLIWAFTSQTFRCDQKEKKVSFLIIIMVNIPDPFRASFQNK